jgi:tetratricopeptide (TPR) repeat protein
MIGRDDNAALFDLALAHRRQGRPKAALEIMDGLIRAHPALAALHANRGAILIDLNDHAAALDSLERAIARKADDAAWWNLKGVCLQLLKRRGEALAAYDRAIALAPVFAEAHYNRGSVLGEMDRLEEALSGYDEALRLDPAMVQAQGNKAELLTKLGRPLDAIAWHDKAIARLPRVARLSFNKGLCLLALGRYQEGWPLYDARLRDGLIPLPKSDLPLWRAGTPLGGRLLIHAEQGLGDTIQFSRYAALAAERGMDVVFSVQRPLLGLLRDLHPGVAVIADSEPPPPSDTSIMLMSLPRAFHTDAGTIPAPAPTLAAEPRRVARWRDRIGGHGIRVGIAWQGDPKSFSDSGRSIPLAHFAPLARIAGLRLISLQKDDGVEQLDGVDFAVERLGADFDAGADAFLDSAAVMQSLDLVVTSDTAIAHLAGALNRPAWVALKFAPDWRWLLDRADSPWYPSMRLFRQTRRGDWDGVFADIEAALRDEFTKEAP